MQGVVFDIKRFAIHDGPGLRTTIFLKGCPLDCWWCHNPESKNPEIQKYIAIDKIDDQQFKVQREIGMLMSVEEVMAEIEKERVFMEEGNGGVTLSGGEPLYQPKFSTEILIQCKQKGLHTTLDTSGFVKEADFKSSIPFTDLFLYDLKLADNELHKKYTGVDLKLIMNNLINAVESRKHVIARIPIIPGINLNYKQLKSLADMIRPLRSDSFNKVHLLPYHLIGKSKNTRYGFEDKMKTVEEPSRSKAESFAALFEDVGFNVHIQ